MQSSGTPENIPYQGSVLLGVGSGGCRIAARLCELGARVERYAYISCDEDDLTQSTKGDKLLIPRGSQADDSPSFLRGLGLRYLPEIRALLQNSTIVFITAGLGGSVGSGLAPLVASTAAEHGARVIAIVAMPYQFERNRHFYAGIALRRLRTLTQGVIIIDNDEFLESAPQKPILELYEDVNVKICSAIKRMLAGSGEKEFAVGLVKFMETVKHDGYSVLSVQSSSSANRAEEAVMATVQAIYRTTEPGEASRAIVYLISDESLSPNELSTSMNRIGSLLGGGSLQIQHGMSMNGKSDLSAILLASGFKTTKFDSYDPLSKLLIGRELDFEPESSFPLDIEGLVQIE